MNGLKDIILVTIASDIQNIKLDDIYMVTTNLEEVKMFIETAISMKKTKYMGRTGIDAANDFNKGWQVISTIGDDVSTEYICSEMTDRLSDIHMQVWQDGELRGGRL